MKGYFFLPNVLTKSRVYDFQNLMWCRKQTTCYVGYLEIKRQTVVDKMLAALAEGQMIPHSVFTFYVLWKYHCLHLNLRPTDGANSHKKIQPANSWFSFLILLLQSLISYGVKARFYSKCKMSRNDFICNLKVTQPSCVVCKRYIK